MTNAIEQTKREMYYWLAQMKNSISMRLTPNYSIERFEPALEAHLEELRKALVAGSAVIVNCEQNSTESFVELERRLAAMTEERDAIQLRLHAVDHAYSKSKINVGMQLDLIELLRKELRESYRFDAKEAGTCGQVCADRRASEHPDANMAVVMETVRGAQDIMVEYLVPDGIRAKRAMTKLIPVLDNEKLYSALYELEHAEVKV